jgi:hypothetical protein
MQLFSHLLSLLSAAGREGAFVVGETVAGVGVAVAHQDQSSSHRGALYSPEALAHFRPITA